MYKTVFGVGEIYHVFNRGVELRPVFTTKREYERALDTIDYYRFQNPTLRLSKALLLNNELREQFFLRLYQTGKKLVDVLVYCLMPNHFHFLVKQNIDSGVQKFMSNFENSYTRYFNTKNSRIGPLFQGIFKAVRIENDEQLMHVSRYIHLNPVVSFVIPEKDFIFYEWSSLPEYAFLRNGLCEKHDVLSYFSSNDDYLKFIRDQIDYGKKLEQIKHLLLE